jgi:hypothetical protein
MVDTAADFGSSLFDEGFRAEERLHARYEVFCTSAARHCRRFSDPSRHLEMTLWDLKRNTNSPSCAASAISIIYP